MAQSPARARRRWAIIALGVVVGLGLLFSALSGFYVDLLWFREVHFASVFWSVFWSKVVLGSIFGAVFFALLVTNLFIARRITPTFRAFTPEQEIIERYRAAFEPYARWIIIGFSALIALLVGLAAAQQWQTFLLWRSVGNVQFGAKFVDPVFHRDPSFYIFVLPFQKYVQGWLFSALVGVFVITGIAHYLSGGIRAQPMGERVTPLVKVHLSVLLGVIVLVKAWGYYLGRYDLLVSPRGVVIGASYTDIHAQKPALFVLLWVAVICAVLFFVNIRLRGWILPVFGIGLLALTSIVAGAIVPAFVQKFRVAPQAFQKEEPFIERNIQATREAFGLDRIQLTPQVRVDDDVTPAQVEANQATIDNIRLWRPSILRETYESLQRFQPYYEFSDVDVDRYVVNGERRVVMLSPREVSQKGIPAGGRTWQNLHLFYTHGYGAVAAAVNNVTTEGQPVFVLKDIPPVGTSIAAPSETGSQIYYGERADPEAPYVVVDSAQKELNFPDPDTQELNTTEYQGKGGIPVGGFFRRLVFAYRYKDINLLISGLINGDSRILINREIRSRIAKAAPFLKYDKDPYAAIVDGRLVYIQDAFTTTSLYPYSQRVSLSDATDGDLSGSANYIRNSVKAVVDAYDGTVTFYVVDPTDPLIQVWERAFPALFSRTPPPPSLRDHFRYPEDLLMVQANQFANYHVTDPQAFFGRGRFWAVPDDPTSANQDLLRPYYVLLKLPGATDEQFVLFVPFTPFNRPNMVAYMAAVSDPDQYGKIQVFEVPSGVPIDGPQQVFNRINQDPTFSAQRSLLGQQGSTVEFGDLLIIPIEDSFLYVEPVYVVSSNENAIPELKRVLVVHGGTVSLGNTLSDALEASFGATPPTQPPPPGGPPATGDVADLLAQAVQHFQTAEQLLRQGDLAGYQREIQAAQALVQQAAALAGGSATPSPSPSPTPSASPSG